MTERNTTIEAEAFFSDSSHWLFGGVTPPSDALESAAAGERDVADLAEFRRGAAVAGTAVKAPMVRFAVAPDAAFLLTADHGMNYKKRCWDLDKALGLRGAPVRFALSAEKDRYIKHHRTFGGTAYVWLNTTDDTAAVTERILQLDGIESVMTREQAALEFGLMPERIGELVVTGDRDTVFGELPGEFEALETGLPLARLPARVRGAARVIYNYKGALPESGRFSRNADLAHFLFC